MVPLTSWCFAEVTQAESLTRLENDAWRTDELGHNDTLGAVHDERALLGLHREVAHEDDLLLDFAGVAIHESRPDEDRCREGHVLLFALLHRELRWRAQVWIERVELKLKLEVFREVLNRRDAAERLRQSLVEEVLEGFGLNRNQVGELEGLLQVAERITFTRHGTNRHGSLSIGSSTSPRLEWTTSLWVLPATARDVSYLRKNRGD